MVTSDDIRKLATLSRLELTDEEVKKMEGEFSSILAYIDTIQKVELPAEPAGSAYLELENVMRDDVPSHDAGVHTEELLKQAPRTGNGYVKVKKILG